MSTRVLSHRPSIPSLQTHNIASTSRNISPTPKRQQTSQHRTTSSRGSHRSRHQSPILSAESSTATTPDLSVKHTYMGDELFRMPDQDSSQPFPVSPTPKKGGNGKKGSNTGKRTDRRGGDGVQRSKLVSRLDIEMTHSNDDDSALFDLLGVASVDDLVSEEDVAKGSNPEPTAMPSTRPQRGILAISKADIEGEKRNKNQRRKKQAAQSDPERSPRQHSQFDSSTIDTLPNGKALLNSEREVYSEGEGKKKSTRKTKNNAKNDKGKESAHAKDVAVSGLSASRPMSRPTDTPSKPLSTGPHRHNDDDAFETASLSQSLPSNGALAGARGNLAKKSKNKKAANGKDESSVWEMPQDTGSGTQTLTWQQKLQTNPTDSPRRNKSAQSNNTPSAGDKKPRSRHNTANVPLPFPPSAMANSPFANNGSRPRHNRRVSADNIPISAFDDTLPFHTGLNVNRAPQTPAKLPTSMAPASVLPVLPGEFPRIGKSSQGPFSMPPAQVNGMGTPLGIKYAGPTFHNSPHAASLPKPDLDDF